MAVVGPAEGVGEAVIVVGGDGDGAPWGKSLVHSASHCQNHMGGQIQTQHCSMNSAHVLLQCYQNRSLHVCV